MRWQRLSAVALAGVAFLFLGQCGCSPVMSQEVATGPVRDIVQNGGFEKRAGGLPVDWKPEPAAAGKGSVSVVPEHRHAGGLCLRLAPNRNNTEYDLTGHPLGVGQGFPAGPFRGKRMVVSAWMGAQGGAVAVVQLVAMKRDGSILTTRLRQGAAGPDLARREDFLPVPADPAVEYLVLLCLVEGTDGAAWFDDIAVSAQAPVARPAARDEGGALSATVAVDAGSTVRHVPETLFGTNIEWIWDGNGLWNDRTGGLDQELVGLTRDLKVSVSRFPGGIFADFYHWKDGTGPRDGRAATAHIPGGPTSVHRFGTDEALDFAARTGGSLMMTVNVATGTPGEAAEWVRYTNRSRKGTPPVVYWEIGNEQYVRDNSAHNRPATMSPEKYAGRFLEFARAMRAVDPSIRLGAVSDIDYGHVTPHAYPDWTGKVLRIAGREIDFLAVHCAYAPGIWMDKGWDARTVYSAMLGAPGQVRVALDSLSRIVERVAPDRAPSIRVAVTEWGPYFQVEPGGRYVDHVKTLGSALYVASVLKEFAESPRTDIANFFKLNDRLFMGWIGQRRGAWAPTAAYLAFQMYTRHFGRDVVPCVTVSPGYDSPEVGKVDAASGIPYLEVVASRDGSGTLYVLGVNRHFDRAVRARISIRGFRPGGQGTAWVLNGTGLDANTGTELFQAPGAHWGRQARDEANPRFDRGGPDEVRVTSSPLARVGGTFEYMFPAHSVVSLEIRGR